MTPSASSIHILARVEEFLGRYYGFVPHVGVRDFATIIDDPNARGAVRFAYLEDVEELAISLYLGKDIAGTLEREDPFTRLTHTNLDAFLVLVEEVSHFHLIINRLQRSLPVTHLELEWQGEMDKILLASDILASQTGDAHLAPLAQLLFDRAQVLTHNPLVGSPSRIQDSAQHDVYRLASDRAAAIWFHIERMRLFQKTPSDDKRLRQLLRHAYHGSWDTKEHVRHQLRRAS